MKIFIESDLEGTAGIFTRGAESRERMVRLVSLEVAAVISGARKAGVEEITVNVGHDLDIELLPPGIRIVKGRPTPSLLSQDLEDTFDAVMITGKHAMAGGRE